MTFVEIITAWWFLLVAIALGALMAKGVVAILGSKAMNLGVGLVLMIFGAVVLVGPAMGVDLGPLSAGAVDNNGGDNGGGGGEPAALGTKSIGTINTNLVRRADGQASAVKGTFRVFSASVNPAAATANPIWTANEMTTGINAFSPSGLQCNVPYNVVFEGNASTGFYDKVWEDYVFDCPVTDESAPTIFFDGGGDNLLDQVGTIDDILNELNNTAVNGQSATGNGESVEIECSGQAAADCTLLYDESTGDGVFYLDLTLAASASNTVVKDYALQFEDDSTNPPEWDEFDDITWQLQSGTDVIALAKDGETRSPISTDSILNFASSNVPIVFGDLKAGLSGKVRVTFTVDEAAIDANDDFTIEADDLGGRLERDIRRGTKATRDTVTFGGSQA